MIKLTYIIAWDKTWADCQVLLPHTKEIMCHVSKNKEGFLNWAIKAGWYPYLKEQYEEAEAMH